MDCCAFAGGWIKEATGKDPYGIVRGSYATAGDVRRLVSRAGGLVALVERTLAGFPLTDDPQHGDIGIIEVPKQGPLGVAGFAVVIRSADWWIGKTETGIAGLRAPHVRAWTIE